MKLRLRPNTLRLRLNRLEVADLSEGKVVEQEIVFPGNQVLRYRLGTGARHSAELTEGVIAISLPSGEARKWGTSEDIGIYFDAGPLAVSIEKDLECTNPREEHDPDAFERKEVCL